MSRVPPDAGTAPATREAEPPSDPPGSDAPPSAPSSPPESDPADTPTPEGVQRVVLNAIFLLLAYALPRALTFGSVVVAARVLGASDFGSYSTAAAFAVILSILATLGMMPLLIRDLARQPGLAPELMRAAHVVKTGSNVVMLLVLVVLVRWVLAYPEPVQGAALLLGLSYAVGAYGENLGAYFQAIERMHVWTQASAAYGLVTGVVGLALILATSSLVWFAAAPLVGQVAAVAWLLRRAPAEVRVGRGGSRDRVRLLLRHLAPFAAAYVALTIYYKLDVLLLARWRPPADVGVYNAAYKFVDIFQALVLVAVVAVYPRLSRAAPRGEEPRRWAGTRVTELALLVALPVAGGLWLLRDPVIGLLYGDAYGASVPVLGVLAVVLPALALNILAGYVLGAAGKMLHVAVPYAGAVVVNALLNALLIPRLGPQGAALSMLCSEILLGGVLLAVLHHQAAAFPERRVLAVVLAAALLVPLAALLPDPSGGVLAAAGFAVAVLLLYARSGVVPPEERWALQEALRRFVPGNGGGRRGGEGRP